MTNDADVTAGHPEVCFNLWAFADQDTGIIMRISGKAYVLPGSEVEKRALLSHLAATDFYSVAWHQVPKHLVMVNPAGSEVHGAVTPRQLDDVGTVFGALLDEINSMPVQLRSVAGEYQQIRLTAPTNPLSLVTVVIEREDGALVPIVNH